MLNEKGWGIMDKQRRTAVLLPILFTFVFLLTLHPKGITMRFAYAPDAYTYVSYPHYSMMPFGYGNWGPMITFTSTVIATVQSYILVFTGKEKLFAMIRNYGIVSIVGSAISLMLSGTMNMVGFTILAFTAVAAAFAHEAYMK